MRLWHQNLIPYLPCIKTTGDRKKNQLGGQWAEIWMIHGSIKKHGKVNHSTVNYVNDHPIDYLSQYAYLVMQELKKRGFKINPTKEALLCCYNPDGLVYPEHNDEYLKECLDNLASKGINIKL